MGFGNVDISLLMAAKAASLLMHYSDLFQISFRVETKEGNKDQSKPICLAFIATHCNVTYYINKTYVAST